MGQCGTVPGEHVENAWRNGSAVKGWDHKQNYGEMPGTLSESSALRLLKELSSG